MERSAIRGLMPRRADPAFRYAPCGLQPNQERSVTEQLASDTIGIAQPRPRTVATARPRFLTGRMLAFVLLAMLLALLTVVPLATVVVGSFRPMGLPLSAGWTLDHYAQVWGDAYTYVL